MVTSTSRYIWGSNQQIPLEWQPYDGTPLPRNPVVSNRKLTDDYRPDAWVNRPGIRRRRKKPNLQLDPAVWMRYQSTNRLVESKLMQTPDSEQYRAQQLQQIQKQDREHAEDAYGRSDEPPPAHTQADTPPAPPANGSLGGLRWRLCPWAIPTDVEPVTSLAPPSGLTTARSLNGVIARPGSNGLGDPRAGFGFDTKLNMPAPRSPPTPSRLPPLDKQPSLPRSVSPSNPKLPNSSRSPNLSPKDTKKSFPDDHVLTQYELFRAQATLCGTTRQALSPLEQGISLSSGSLTGFDVFTIDFREHWNAENPSLSDAPASKKENAGGEFELPLSDALLSARRQRIAANTRAAWDAMKSDERAEYNERARVLSEPPPPTIEEMLSKTDWEEMNAAREWWSSQAERDVLKMRLCLTSLEAELNGVSSVAKNVESTVIDEFNPEHIDSRQRSTVAEEAEIDEERKEETVDLQAEVDDLNTLLRMRRVPNKSSLGDRKSTKEDAIYMGSGIATRKQTSHKKRRVRRSSLSIADLQWNKLSSLQQAGVFSLGSTMSKKKKAQRRRSVCPVLGRDNAE